MRIKKILAFLLTAAMLVISLNVIPFNAMAADGSATGTEKSPAQASIKVRLHVHGDWTYEANGATLTAKCFDYDNCNYSAAFTLTAAATTVFSGSEVTASADDSEWKKAGLTVPAITYEYRETSDGTFAATTETKAVGYYRASATVDGKTAYVEFAIIKEDITPSDTGNGKDTEGKGDASGKTTSIKRSDDIEKTGSVTIPDTLTADGEERTVIAIAADAFNKEKKLEAVSLPDTIEKIGRRAFKNCSKLEKLEIGENVKQMNRSAFYGCKKLTSVELNDRLEYVGGFAFKNCTSLKSFTFGSGVKKLGRSLFSGCTSLESIVIPKNVVSMGKNLFYGCKSLKTLTIETTKLTGTSLSKGVFRNVPKDMVIYVPKSKKSAYEKLFREKGLNANVQIKAIGE